LTQTHYSHLVLYVRTVTTVPCKTNDASERTLRRRWLSVYFEPKSCNFYKSLFKLLTL